MSKTYGKTFLTGPNGRTRWAIDDQNDPGEGARRGHQIMPAITFGAGKLQAVYYDFNDDYSADFGQFVDDADNPIHDPDPSTPKKFRRRHTVDVRAAQADPRDVPSFVSVIITPNGTSPRVSQFRTVTMPDGTVKQVQYNPPNFPLYVSGSIPFIGDYIDIQALVYAATDLGYQYNLGALGPPGHSLGTRGYPNPPIFHAAWTDHRDVTPPADGDWTKYVAPLPVDRTAETRPGTGTDPADERDRPGR